MSYDVLQAKRTALHYAARDGHATVVQLLCRAGATLDAKTNVS